MAANPHSREASLQRVAAPAESEPSAAQPSQSETTRDVKTQPEIDAVIAAPAVIATDGGCESHHEATAKAAYFLAAARGFHPGHELDDWLLAEQQLGLR